MVWNEGELRDLSVFFRIAHYTVSLARHITGFFRTVRKIIGLVVQPIRTSFLAGGSCRL